MQHSTPPAPAYLSKASVATFLDMTEDEVDVLVARGTLPKPMQLAPNLHRWSRRAIEAAIGAIGNHGRPKHEPMAFTPATLAEEWSCSDRHIRNLIARGELVAMKLGGTLIRISRDEAEAFLLRNRTAKEQP